MDEQRLLVLQGSPLKVRLNLLRRIAELAGPDNEWERDIFEHENERLYEIERELRENPPPNLSRERILTMDHELESFLEGHFIISDVRRLWERHLPQYKLNDQWETLESLRKHLQIEALPFSEMKTLYEDSLKTLRCQNWDLPSAQFLLKEFSDRHRQLIDDEEKRNTETEKRLLNELRLKLGVVPLESGESHYRSLINEIENRKWSLVTESTELAREVRQALSEFLDAEERDKRNQWLERFTSQLNDLQTCLRAQDFKSGREIKNTLEMLLAEDSGRTPRSYLSPEKRENVHSLINSYDFMNEQYGNKIVIQDWITQATLAHISNDLKLAQRCCSILEKQLQTDDLTIYFSTEIPWLSENELISVREILSWKDEKENEYENHLVKQDRFLGRASLVSFVVFCLLCVCSIGYGGFGAFLLLISIEACFLAVLILYYYIETTRGTKPPQR